MPHSKDQKKNNENKAITVMRNSVSHSKDQKKNNENKAITVMHTNVSHSKDQKKNNENKKIPNKKVREVYPSNKNKVSKGPEATVQEQKLQKITSEAISLHTRKEGHHKMMAQRC